MTFQGTDAVGEALAHLAATDPILYVRVDGELYIIDVEKLRRAMTNEDLPASITFAALDLPMRPWATHINPGNRKRTHSEELHRRNVRRAKPPGAGRKPVLDLDDIVSIIEPESSFSFDDAAVTVGSPAPAASRSFEHEVFEPVPVESPAPSIEPFDFGRGYADQLPMSAPAPVGAAPAPMAAPPPEPAAPAPHPTSWINAEVEGHDAGEPLRPATQYVLAFWTAQTVSEHSLLGDTSLQYNFAPGEADVTLTIQLMSDDVDVAQPVQLLVVRADGISRGRARFDITPKRAGTAAVTAVFLKDGNLIQKIELALHVGDAAQTLDVVRISGRTAPPMRVKRRDITLELERTADGFRIAAYGDARPARGKLLMSDAQLEALIGSARDALQKIVDTQDGFTFVYQEAAPIPAAIAKKSVADLARAGSLLFRNLFFSAGADDDVKAIGRKLIAATNEPATLRIQVTTNRMLLPWGILYAVERFDPNNIDPTKFLGFRHIVEQVPLVKLPAAFDDDISHGAALSVGFNVNRDIDAAMNLHVIEEQLAYWHAREARGHATLIVRDAASDVAAAINTSSTPDQLTYCYCHADAPGLTQGGPQKAMLMFTGNQQLTVEDLMLGDDVSAPTALAAKPLVFINACNSAHLSPLVYDGFVPYLLSKGARGVIGTECTAPAIFASRWALAFFDEFMQGGEVGDIVLKLRRKFLNDENNVLGLIYALYCNVNTRIDPAIGGSA